jgi:hypothetical protein
MGRFSADYHGIGELLNSAEVEAEMVRRAELLMAAAVASAPFDAKDRDLAHYKDSFHLEHGKHRGVHHDRAEAAVVNDSPHAVYVEYGTGDTPKHRTLGHAIDAARD